MLASRFIRQPAAARLLPRITAYHPVRFYSDTSAKAQTRTKQEEPAEEEEENQGEQPKSAYARFKLLTKKYGWWALGMYTALSFVDFSLTFLIVHTLGTERIEPVLNAGVHKYRSIRYGEEEADKMAKQDKVDAEKKAKEAKAEEAAGKTKNAWASRSLWAEIILAYTIHKAVLLPVRAGLTVAWTPKVVNWLASRGWIGKVRSSTPA